MAPESAAIWSASFAFCPIETAPEIFSALMFGVRGSIENALTMPNAPATIVRLL